MSESAYRIVLMKHPAGRPPTPSSSAAGYGASRLCSAWLATYQDGALNLVNTSIRRAATLLALSGAVAGFVGQTQAAEPPLKTFEERVFELKQFSREMLSTDSLLNSLVDGAYGEDLSPQKKTAARGYMRAVMETDAYALHVVKKLDSLANATISREQSRAIFGDMVETLRTRGVNRLPSAAKLTFVTNLADTMREESPETCISMSRGRLTRDEDVAIHRRHLRSLSDERFAAVLSIYRDAVLAELNDNPPVPSVTDGEAKLADDTFKVIVRKRLLATLDKDALASFAKAGMGSEASVACQVTLGVMDSFAELEEPLRTWELTSFINSFSETSHRP